MRDITPASRTTFQELRINQTELFEQVIAIYEEAIPLHERKDRSELRAMLSSTQFRFVVCLIDARVLGFAILYVGKRIAVLEYLAIARAERGGGLGHQLYRKMQRLSTPLPLIIEVEPECDDCANSTERRRRLGFYRSLGCRRLEGVEFTLPLGSSNTRLHLLVDRGCMTLTREIVASWLTEMYTEVYHCSSTDPRLRATISELKPHVVLD